jgi:site-specific DNA recombinase
MRAQRGRPPPHGLSARGAVLPPLDAWLARIFDSDRIEDTGQQLAVAAATDTAKPAELEAAQRKLADCNTRLTRYGAAREAGTDPTVVAAWVAEVQAERAVAERALAQLPAQSPMEASELRQRVQQRADIPQCSPTPNRAFERASTLAIAASRSPR